jgi:rubrerythrin
MKKLQIFICENFYPEYQAALQREGINDVNLSIFPSLCDSKKEKSEVTKIFSKAKKEQSVLICSRSCDRMKVCSQTSWACPEEREDGIEF